MRFVSVAVLAVFYALASAQEVDTTSVQTILTFEHKLDSLRQQIRLLASELQAVKANLAEGTDLDALIAALNNEELDAAPEDQRSRRKRVDALLKAISQRPGQLRFNGGATTVIQGNLDLDEKFSTATGSIDLYAHTSFGPRTLLFFAFEAIGGNGPDQHIQTLASLNGDAGSTQSVDGLDRLTVLEAWAEFTILNERIAVTAGKIDFTNYFDNNAVANDETAQFISASFVNSAALPVPGNSPGIRVRTTVLKRFFLQGALASTDNSGDKLFDDIFKMGSVGFRLFEDSSWEGNLRFYLYSHPSAGNSTGYGTSFDQAIGNMFRVFARWNRNRDRLAEWFGVAQAWSLGASITKRVQGKRLVVAGAFGNNAPFSQALNHEKLFEFYGNYQLNRWVYVSPHLQVLLNANGSSRSATLLGLRTQFNF